MDVSRLNQLSERQRECLRLLFANLAIKEIGRELKLSPNTVRGHLRDTRRLLGASRSMQAARMLVAYEHDTLGIDPPNRLGHPRQFIDEALATHPDDPGEVVRNRYTLSFLQRAGLIMIIAFIAVALLGALLVGADAVTRIFQDHKVDLSDPPYRQ